MRRTQLPREAFLLALRPARHATPLPTTARTLPEHALNEVMFAAAATNLSSHVPRRRLPRPQLCFAVLDHPWPHLIYQSNTTTSTNISRLLSSSLKELRGSTSTGLRRGTRRGTRRTSTTRAVTATCEDTERVA